MGFLKYLVVIALFSINIAESKSIQLNKLIISDFNQAGPNEFPWQVAIRGIDKFNSTLKTLCSGSLLSAGNNSWVITAAQCVANSSNITIGLGSVEIHEPELIVTASKLIINPGFMNTLKDGYMNDIALIKLDEIIEESESIKSILMPSEDQLELSFEGVTGISAGWGTVEESMENKKNHTNESDNKLNVIKGDDKKKQNEMHERLNWQEMSVISNQECKTIFGSLIVKNTLCARVINNGNINLCGSDYGAPLLLEEDEGWKIIAVASYTQGCDSQKPAVFSRMTSFMKWISEETGLEIPHM